MLIALESSARFQIDVLYLSRTFPYSIHLWGQATVGAVFILFLGLVLVHPRSQRGKAMIMETRLKYFTVEGMLVRKRLYLL